MYFLRFKRLIPFFLVNYHKTKKSSASFQTKKNKNVTGQKGVECGIQPL